MPRNPFRILNHDSRECVLVMVCRQGDGIYNILIIYCLKSVLTSSAERNLPAKIKTTSWVLGPLDGVFNEGLSRSGLVLRFFILFCPFWGFPIFWGFFIFWGDFTDVSGIFPIGPVPLSRPFKAHSGNMPERVRDEIGTFPEIMGNPPLWKLLGLASLKFFGSENVMKMLRNIPAISGPSLTGPPIARQIYRPELSTKFSSSHIWGR